MPAEFEIVIFADPRFTGGTSTAVAAEISALEQLGIRPGFCPVLSAAISRSRDWHLALSNHLVRGQIVLIDPAQNVTARLVIIHHPRLFEHMAAIPLGIVAENVVLVVSHPPRNGHGQDEYDLITTVANIAETFGVRPLLGPVGPAVRRQLAAMSGVGADILAEDWSNLFDRYASPVRARRPNNAQIVIGRHSRPQLSKWPDAFVDACAAYPTDPRFEIRMLGAPADLGSHYGGLPSNWQLIPFSGQDVGAFLDGLDFYSYFHGSAWIEAFGYSILEAIAKGIPALLPHHFQPLFGPAAIYCTPDEVTNVVLDYSNSADLYQTHVETARAYVDEKFGLEQYGPRLDRLFPGRRNLRGQQPEKGSAGKKRFVFVTSNGTGLGHLSRCFAIAKNFRSDVEVSFFTLSKAFQLAADQGYLTQYVPFHQTTGADPATWNLAFAEELSDFLVFWQPDVLVFDGNVPYDGMAKALAQHPEVKRIWVRRALWAPSKSQMPTTTLQFDAVVEPGEISARFDTGPTKHGRDNVFGSPPILQLRPEDRLSRSAARAELGIDQNAFFVSLMLGLGNNFDFGGIRAALIQAVLADGATDIIEFIQPLQVGVGKNHGPRHSSRSAYPAFRLSRAFDFAIASAGYNTFHEHLLGAVPTIFVPNEAPEMDRQMLRARHAKAIGCAELVRASDRISVPDIVSRMRDDTHRAEMVRRMERLVFADGAVATARFIERYCHYLVLNRPLAG